MEENFKIRNFSSDDVILFNSGICKAEKIIDILKAILIHELSPELCGRFNRKLGLCVMQKYNIFDQGIECEILKVGAKGWQRGKIKIKVALEFCPDDSDNSKQKSNLDDIHSVITKDNQNLNDEI
mgnify:CR=1 FL=1